jgi:hypothetical protein
MGLEPPLVAAHSKRGLRDGLTLSRRRKVGKGSSETASKPCICHIKKSGWPWKATGEVNAGQRVEKCRICGATHLVTA